MPYIGAKTLDLPQFEKIESLEEAERILRIYRDVIEELMRRLQDLEKATPVMLGKVEHVATGLDYCYRVVMWDMGVITGDGDNVNQKDSVRKVLVYNNEEAYKSETDTLVIGDWMIIWRVPPMAGYSQIQYAGLPYYGRATIGLL